MNKSSLLAALCLSAACRTVNAPAGVPPLASADTIAAHTMASGVVGWYTTTGDRHVLVTWGAAGGLRIIDTDSARFQRLALTDDPARLRLRQRGDSTARDVLVERAPEGTARRLTIIRPDSSPRVLRRSEGPYRQRLLTYVSHGDTLVATLLEPVAGAVAGAVLVHGSGDSDRDDLWYWTIADYLARRRIAVLFPDKRGSGSSGGDWHAADFDLLADDAIAGRVALCATGAVRCDRVGLVGISQGGWVAPLAATKDHDVAYVVNVSGAAVTPADQARHEIRQDLVRAGLTAPMIDEVLSLHDAAAAYIRGRIDFRTYSAARERGLRRPWASAAAAFPASDSTWEWAWWRGVLDFDPVPVWQSVKAPALVVYGEDDEFDNVPVQTSVSRLERLRAHRNVPPLTIRTYPGSGHGLRDGNGRIRPDFLSFLAAWIASAAGS